MEASRLTSCQALLLDGVSRLDALETVGHRVTVELLVALETLQHLEQRETCLCDRHMELRTGCVTWGQISWLSASIFSALRLCLVR